MYVQTSDRHYSYTLALKNHMCITNNDRTVESVMLFSLRQFLKMWNWFNKTFIYIILYDGHYIEYLKYKKLI